MVSEKSRRSCLLCLLFSRLSGLLRIADGTAVRACMMRLLICTADRAFNQSRSSELVMRSSLISSGLGISSLLYCHLSDTSCYSLP